jgi:hypothetical protein
MQAVKHSDRSAPPVVAVKTVGHWQKNDGSGENARLMSTAASVRLPGEPAVMADPEHPGNDEAQHQREQPRGA